MDLDEGFGNNSRRLLLSLSRFFLPAKYLLYPLSLKRRMVSAFSSSSSFIMNFEGASATYRIFLRFIGPTFAFLSIITGFSGVQSSIKQCLSDIESPRAGVNFPALIEKMGVSVAFFFFSFSWSALIMGLSFDLILPTVYFPIPGFANC